MVTVPPGSTNCSGTIDSNTLACCLIDTVNVITPAVEVSSESSQSSETSEITHNFSTTEDSNNGGGQTDSSKCNCVPKDKCSVNEYNHPNIDIRHGCSKNEICCNEEHTIDKSEYFKDDVQSCGVGMPPPSNYYNDIGTRIVNSIDKSETYFGQFPWMVAILKSTTDQTTGEKTENVFQCGGSLIHPQVILTAAHCVNGFKKNIMKIRVGEWDTQSEGSEENHLHQDFGISEVIIHPNHNNASMFNDVALVQLDTPVKLQKHINTICIPHDKKTNYDSRLCVSTGWGKNGFGGKNDRYQNVLKKVKLSLVSNDLCQQQLRQTRVGNYFRLHDSFICAGGVKGEDVCRGDGGGPLVCVVKEKKSTQQKYIQVGIVSWGIGCGDENVPGVYSSLVSNYQWINKHLKLLTS